MDNLIEQRSSNFVLKAELSAKSAFEMLQIVYGESCLKKTAVYKWFSRFRDGQESVFDDDNKSGHLSETQTEENMFN